MLTAPEILMLKAAQKRLVTKAGGQEACTLVPGMRLKRHQSFNDFGRADLPDRHMPIDVLATLERDSGVEVTRVLAELNNCLLVPLPVGTAHGAVTERSGRSATEFAEVMAGVFAALGDGRITATEAAPILKDIRELMLELAALAEAVKEAVAKDEEPRSGWPGPERGAKDGGDE